MIKARVSFVTNLRISTAIKGVLGSGCLLVAAGCASSPVEPQAVTGQKASDINWAFADISAMEEKVAALQSENSRLQREVGTLTRQLEKAREAAVIALAGSSDDSILTGEEAAQERRAARQGANIPSGDISHGEPRTEISANDVETASAPKLVQPTFASAETNFENDVAGSQLALASVMWGVHLESYAKQRGAREGWRKLQRSFPDELGLLEPRTKKVAIKGLGDMFRLIGGGFASQNTAKALCGELAIKNQYCKVVAFDGERF